MAITLSGIRSGSFAKELETLPLLGPVLCVLWSVAWLLPNHARPWAAFHTDAWIAAGLCAAFIWIAWRARDGWRVSRTATFLILLSLIPWIQFAMGLVTLTGVATMSSIFLLGLALSYSLGENWGRQGGNTAIVFVLAAAACAAYVSVGLQLYQWLGLTDNDGAMDIWVLYFGGRGRPDANLGQPNQLATLQLWGLLAVAWAQRRKAIGVWGVVLAAGPLLFGIALTQSRTAILTLTVWLILLWLFAGKRLLSRRWLMGATALYGGYLSMLVLVGPVARQLGLEVAPPLSERLDVGLRLPGWRMFIDAVTERPWLGYGWDQTRWAMFEVFPRHTELAGLPFSHAHNLFLELVLWLGIPLGGLLSLGLLFWITLRFLQIRTVEQMLVFAALLAMGLHAMLELPLHYAYFLLPTGLLAGALCQLQCPESKCRVVGRIVVLGLGIVVALLLGIVSRDYLRIEESHLALRFENQGVGTIHNRNPPDTLLLEQWRGVIELSRLKPHGGMSDREVDRWRELAIYHSSGVNLQNMLSILSFNGRHSEAEYWAQRVCAVFEQATCELIIKRWRESYANTIGISSETSGDDVQPLIGSDVRSREGVTD